MKQHIAHITIVVDDYDKAIEFYTKKLQFVLLEDTVIDETKRWVKIAPTSSSEFSLLLAKASNADQKTRIGNQTGGRVFLFLNTSDFENDYKNLIDHSIKIVREPKTESYGKVLVFEDCYGNLWDLIEPIEQKAAEFYTTGILKVRDNQSVQKAKEALLALQKRTLKEPGNKTFAIQQLKEDPTQFVVWECFTNETEFQNHLQSKHVQDFFALGLVEFVKGYETTAL